MMLKIRGSFISPMDCSYCKTQIKAELVYVQKKPPKGAIDLGIEDEYVRGYCPECRHRLNIRTIVQESKRVLIAGRFDQNITDKDIAYSIETSKKYKELKPNYDYGGWM